MRTVEWGLLISALILMLAYLGAYGRDLKRERRWRRSQNEKFYAILDRAQAVCQSCDGADRPGVAR